MRMTFVKLALATGVGMATLAACGSANDGYDPSVATAMQYIGGSGQSADAGSPVDELLTIKTVNFVGDPVGRRRGGVVRRERRRHRQQGRDDDRRERALAGELGPGPDRRHPDGAGGRDPVGIAGLVHGDGARRVMAVAAVAASGAARCAPSGEARSPSLAAPRVRSCGSGLRRR